MSQSRDELFPSADATPTSFERISASRTTTGRPSFLVTGRSSRKTGMPSSSHSLRKLTQYSSVLRDAWSSGSIRSRNFPASSFILAIPLASKPVTLSSSSKTVPLRPPLFALPMRSLRSRNFFDAAPSSAKSSSMMSGDPSRPSKGEQATTRSALPRRSRLSAILSGSSPMEVTILATWSTARSVSFPSLVSAFLLTLFSASLNGSPGSPTRESVIDE